MFRILFLAAVLAGAIECLACTSMIISAERSASGRPLLWKHRDTDADNNFIARVEPTDTTFGYIGLFNAGDSLLAEAWMGMNDHGFAVMNTASYNLAPHESNLTDREALLMSEALRRCATVDEFERLLDELPKPLGVQANFGVIDAQGGAAYFETSDRTRTRFDVADAPCGYLIRTNHSASGARGEGRGYVRYATAEYLASRHEEPFTPADLTDGFSRQYYHSLLGRDCSGDSIVINVDFIPRPISTASLVVEGIVDTISTDAMRMWGCLGYPPCAVSRWITFDEIPADFLPSGPQWRSAACDEAFRLYRTAVPAAIGGDNPYIDMTILRPIIERCRANDASTDANCGDALSGRACGWQECGE